MKRAFSMRSRELIIKPETSMLLILLILFLAAGCGTPQKAVSQTDTVKHAKPAEEKSHAAHDTILSEIPEVAAEKEKDTVDLALILPFYLDSVSEIPDTVEVNYPQDSRLAIEFYNGVMMAVEELAGEDLRIRMHVYDDANDKTRIQKIIQSPDFKKSDLMLGPVYNNNLRFMADYAKRDSIYLVSPFSPASGITSNNPYYVMMNPSIEVHCRKIFDYVARQHHDDNILLFTRPGTPEAQYADIFQNYLKQYQTETNDYSLQFTQVIFAPDYAKEQAPSNNTLEAYFRAASKNIVIVPSVDKAYINSVGRDLYPLVAPPREKKDAVRYDISAIGFPVWGDEEGLRLDYAQKLNVHFTSVYYVPAEFFNKNNAFYNTYVSRYQNEPTDYVIKGYDMMMYFGKMIEKYGSGFGKHLCTEKTVALHTIFQLGTHQAPSGNMASIDNRITAPLTDFIENKYVHLLKYENFTVRKVE